MAPQLPSPTRRFAPTIVLLLALGACTFLAIAPAESVTGTTGPMKLSVAPTSGLSDGQTVKIHVDAAPGTVLYEIRAHMCDPGVVVKNTLNFSFDGAHCSPSALSAGSDAETLVSFATGASAGDLEFRVGAGTGSPWVDYEGQTHTLNCDASAPCNLVVQLQITDATAFYTAPLCFGPACPPEPSPAPNDAGAPLPVVAAQSGSAQSDSAQPGTPTAGSSQGSGSVPTPAGSSSTAPDKGSGTEAGVPNGSSSPASSHSDGSTGLAAQQSAASAAVTPGLARAPRVFLAGAAGLIGGSLILLIVIRARRQMALGGL